MAPLLPFYVLYITPLLPYLTPLLTLYEPYLTLKTLHDSKFLSYDPISGLSNRYKIPMTYMTPL